MAITSAVQRGAFVYVYGERGQLLSTLAAGSSPRDGLQGYTATTVAIRHGAFIHVYDERGRLQSTVAAR